MKTKLFLSILLIHIAGQGFNQTICLNPAQKKIIRGAAGTTLTVNPFIFFVTGCPAASITNANFYNDNSGTADPRNYSITSITNPSNLSLNGNFTLTLNFPVRPASNDETIILHFRLELNDDTIIHRLDTITITSSTLIASTAPSVTTVSNKNKAKWFKDVSNTNKIEYNQFTDFAGFDNDKPNGRLQTELRCKWALNKNAFGKENSWSAQLFRSIIFPDILFNRIDKSQKEETYNYPAYLYGSSNPDSATPKFTTMDIWKYSNLHIGARIILLAVKKDNFRVHLQAGAKLIKNRPFVDTSLSQTGKTDSSIFRPAYSMAYNIELYGKTLFVEKARLNLDFNVGIMWLYLHDSYYKQYDAAVIDPYERASMLLPVSYPTKKVKPVYMFSFRLIKNIGTDKDHFAYLRGSWMYQTGKYFPVRKRTSNTGETIYQRSNEPVRFYNNFLQIQAGISIDVDDLFKSKKNEKSDSPAISDTAG